MKVTSADCKAYIVEQVHPDTKVSEWKRRSKSKRDDGAVLRVFWNTETNDAVGVIERDGEIIGLQDEQKQDVPEVEVLYCFVESEEEPGCHELYFAFSTSVHPAKVMNLLKTKRINSIEDVLDNHCRTNSLIS